MTVHGPARIALAGTLALALCGCGGRAENVLVPTPSSAPPPGASKIDMLVVTTRERTETPTGEIYSGARAMDRSLFNLVVSIPPAQARKVGTVQWPKSLPADPATDFVTLKAKDMDKAGVMTWFRTVAGPKRNVLIFVHGFNNTFEAAAYRFAQIAHDSGTDAAPILFTWPSGGSVFDYLYDRESGTMSRDALETLMTNAATNPNVGEVTVMAHSMGNWVLIEALRQMAIRRGSIYPKIRNVIMAAPDLDVDVFRSDFLAIPEPRPRITVLVSRDDRALAISRRVAGGIDRLGSIDPDAEPYKSKLAAAEIVAIDLSKVEAGDSLNHGKFAESPEVVKLIGSRLIAGQQVSDADLTLGERIAGATVGAAAAVGSTVAAVATAPVAIVDPATRRSYGRQVRQISQNAGEAAASATGR
ncbi:alpha/beta hydrolase [Hansschlegelia zhihuaiae]|uniref:Alpha/beta hydrolase n=1 Tax=Hansschlegelia zhihuaiae TaxID=405005 RepID=A0A4Q0MJI8_9HYPH|nr:alpha/beta hydrolase [Hansschlegelia zhihuaiae]RXF73718.1 alpha/beta hydrolase [Hansschlegelia zhihuaiae]